jgi:glycogen debranching enzyme
VRLGTETTGDFERASRLEWLVTNGLGGYACGTVAGGAARRYHGLLVAAVRPPVDRIVTVTSLDESVRTPRGTVALSAQQWPGVVEPRGFLALDAFERGLRPRWRFRAHDLFLDKTVHMVPGRNTTVIEYRHAFGPKAELTVRPFVVMRDHHALTHENAAFQEAVTIDAHHVRLSPYEGMPALTFATNAGRFLPWPAWYKNFEYAFEIERGMAFHEDAMTPGPFVVELTAGERFLLVLTVEQGDAVPPGGTALEAWVDAGWSAEEARLEAIARAPRPTARRGEAKLPAELLGALARACDQFWVHGEAGASVIAGYPWFTDWGRDTMISLPGLVAATGRVDHAQAALATFARYAQEGLLPNRFVETGAAGPAGAASAPGAAPTGATAARAAGARATATAATAATAEPLPADYGSVDAALWFAVAAADWFALTGDRAFLRDTLAPTLAATLEAFARGTRFGIREAPDGLLACGDATTALTWMDARVDGKPVTPRQGKPVEVNALWHNAWATHAAFCERLGRDDDARVARARAAHIAEAFAEAFWEPARGWLADRVDGVGPDPSLRPNQLYALALPYPTLEGEPARVALEAVEAALLTPMGPRTLAPGEPRYRGAYVGEMSVRDDGYHNGAVWPFLLGAWADAHFRVRGRSRATREHARRVFLPLVRHFEADACLGSVSEIADGDAPYTPRGTFAQAWSCAELARVWIREGL